MGHEATKRLTVSIVAALVLIASVGAGAARKVHLAEAAEAAVIRIEGKPKGAADLASAIVRVAERTMPAVVYIEVSESRVVENPFWQFQNNPFFQRFFNMPKTPRRFKQEIRGLGSGMIIDAQGDILTNYHVAGTASKMEATLADGRKYPARLVGGDAKTDLAVVRISAPDSLPHVTFGDSDGAEVGEWVVAIGAPGPWKSLSPMGLSAPSTGQGSPIPTRTRTFSRPMLPSIRATAADLSSTSTVR